MVLQQCWRPPKVGGTTRHWGHWAVVRCRLLIDPRVLFKFKFECWNLKTSRFYRYSSKKSETILKNQNLPHPINTLMV
jgi:hypothetical protein